MIKQTEQALSQFDQSTPNVAFLAGAGVIAVFIVAALILALVTSNFLIAAVLVLAAFGFGAFAWMTHGRLTRAPLGQGAARGLWNIDVPDNQRQKLNQEVLALARILEIDKEQLPDLLSAYIVAEDLAIRQIQQEAKMPVLRHVQIGGLPFDGVLVKHDVVTCIEVTFLVTPNVSQEKINFIMNKMATTKGAFGQLKLGTKTRLLLVLVTQLDQSAEAQLRSSLVKKFGQTQVDVDIRLLDFEKLQKDYAME